MRDAGREDETRPGGRERGRVVRVTGQPSSAAEALMTMLRSVMSTEPLPSASPKDGLIEVGQDTVEVGEVDDAVAVDIAGAGAGELVGPAIDDGSDDAGCRRGRSRNPRRRSGRC